MVVGRELKNSRIQEFRSQESGVGESGVQEFRSQEPGARSQEPGAGGCKTKKAWHDRHVKTLNS
jgi:hypothetical protein